jgi:hypothetical protein
MTFIEIGNTLFNLTHIRKVRRFRTHDGGDVEPPLGRHPVS